MNRALLAMGLLLAAGCTPKLDVGSDNPGGSGGGGASPTTDDASGGGGATHDGGGGSGGSTVKPTCTPTAGGDVLEYDEPFGSTMQIAILANTGEATRLAFLNDMPLAAPPTPSGCSVLDSLELIENGATIQKIETGGIDIAPEPIGFVPWLETKAANAVSARCSDLSGNGRVDTVGVLARGRRDGGTFAIHIGRASTSPGWGWPPAVVVSCHEGLVAAPITGDVIRMLSSDPGPSTSVGLSLVRGVGVPELESMGGSIHLMPVAAPSTDDPFNPVTRPLTPIDSSGWTWSKFDTTLPPGEKVRQITMNHQGDILGDTGCPASDGMSSEGNVVVARISGTTSAGPFTSEVSQICQPNSSP